jgi:hypothetical protein
MLERPPIRGTVSARLNRYFVPTSFQVQTFYVFAKRVRKYPNLGWLIPAALVGQIYRQRRQLPLVQNGNQPARDDIVVHDVQGLNENA